MPSRSLLPVLSSGEGLLVLTGERDEGGGWAERVKRATTVRWMRGAAVHGGWIRGCSTVGLQVWLRYQRAAREAAVHDG